MVAPTTLESEIGGQPAIPNAATAPYQQQQPMNPMAAAVGSQLTD